MTETQEKKPFNPNEHLSKVQQPNDYLQVKWRLVWFRDEHPHGKITTSMVHLDVEKQIAVFKATAEDSAGGIGEGYGSETVKDFKDYIEKAETKAVGRALAALGYGTQFAPDLDEGDRIVDSPVDRSATKTNTKADEKPATPAPSPAIQDMARKAYERAKALGINTKEAWDALILATLKVQKSMGHWTLNDVAAINGELARREREKQPA